MRLNRWEFLCMNNPLRRWLMGQVELARFTRLLQQAQVDLQGQRLLDVACGGGHSCRLLRQTFQPSLLVGFDLMPEQLRLARNQGADWLLQADLAELPCKPNSFDAAFGFGILHHVEPWRACARELVRAVRPGGWILLEEPNQQAAQWFRKWVRFAIPRHPGFDFAALEEEFSSLGCRKLGQAKIWLAPFQAFLWQKQAD